jgi:hypothetical protein
MKSFQAIGSVSVLLRSNISETDFAYPFKA